MNHSESLTKLATALVAAQGELENAHKNATNPHFRNQYADLAEIIATVRPVLNRHGLSVVQLPGYAEGVTTVETILTHASGEWLAGTAGARVQKDDPQGVGSAITYLRRYSLAALCAIAQEDDDGQAASNGQSVRQEPRPAPSSEPVGVKLYGGHHADSNGTSSFDLSEEIHVGKHKGKAWADVVEDDPGYIEWAIAKMERLSPAAKQVLRAALELHKVAAAPSPPRPAVPLTEPDDDMPF